MTQVIFARYTGLGLASCSGLSQYLTTVSVTSLLINTRRLLRGETLDLVGGVFPSGVSSEADAPQEHTLIVRWGTPASLGPLSIASDIPYQLTPSRMVLRPSKHAQGKNLWLVNDMQELLNVVHAHPRVFNNGWYASEFIDKVAEYRVYVVQGRVATVARKTPADPGAVAWNVAQGGRFDVVPWGDWPMEAVRVALEAFKHSGLDFSGVDVMIDRDGKAYVIELNSAPSLPFLSDGSMSYRQKCMGKTIRWMVEHGLDHMEADNFDNWRGVIHPAIQEYE